MQKKLNLKALEVQSFITTSEAKEMKAGKQSLNYSECDSCGIACTVVDCPVPSENYTDCGSCGIACTVVEC
ncbi:pinensin family lanthipeptide [Roseivirga sp. BDSF3-8]|uniref:pinensin family lanthipeptide n=1 Tax=Roseivirga sp. BDSF3-8 TaxID=3241598 RepID=UPI003531867C